ncbi:MAG TPA: hypothetical protein VFA88_11305 [Gaiellaceae bacterium]|nr:hypothetical protein [Gaiellaceae bacterium]
MAGLLALVLVTAAWGVTVVQVKHAGAVYPLLAFPALGAGTASLARAGVDAGSAVGGLLVPGGAAVQALQLVLLERRAPEWRSSSRASASGPRCSGFALAGDRLWPGGWGGCALIVAGTSLSEPGAAGSLVRLLRPPQGAA